MAFIWCAIDDERGAAGSDRWAAIELASPACLTDSGVEPIAGGFGALEPASVNTSVLLFRVEGDGFATNAWAMLAGLASRARVNGRPLAAGLRLLADRDSISVGGAPPAYFSTERLAIVEAFAGDEAVYCARCKLEIESGQASVRCPSCEVVFHEHTAAQCWTYAPTCALCDQPTDLARREFRWTPEGL